MPQSHSRWLIVHALPDWLAATTAGSNHLFIQSVGWEELSDMMT